MKVLEFLLRNGLLFISSNKWIWNISNFLPLEHFGVRANTQAHTVKPNNFRALCKLVVMWLTKHNCVEVFHVTIAWGT